MSRNTVRKLLVLKEEEPILLDTLLSTELPKLNGRKLYIWGTGNTEALFQQGLKRLQSEGFEISGYTDSRQNLWGTKVY